MIATDHDEAGEKCAQKLKQRIGDRAFRVRFPAKDINELIEERGYDESRKLLKTAYEDAKWQAPEQLGTVVEFEEELDQFFDAKSQDISGFRSGWEKFDENDIKFREHDLWLVTGFSGSGKSMLLNQLCLNAISQDRKVLIASMEMTPRYTLGRMLMQTTGVSKPSKEWRSKSLDWLSPNLWLFVDELTPKPADLLRTFEYGYRRYGINVFVIDSLTNMVRQDDYEGQQKFVEALVQFKLKFNVTIFLVTHARKQENESRSPNKFDIKGSSAISDLCDGAFSVWKNKPKTEHIQQCEILKKQPNEDIVAGWDVYLEVLKNRHGMWEGKVGFDFSEALLPVPRETGINAKKLCAQAKGETVLNQENFAISIRDAGSQVAQAEADLAVAEATEKRTMARLMLTAQVQHQCKTAAAQTSWADNQDEMEIARIERGAAKGSLAAAKANLLAAEVAFKTWQTEMATHRAERRVYGA